MFDEGHVIASATYNVKDLTTLTDEEIRQEIHLADQAIAKIIRVRPRFIRPPF